MRKILGIAFWLALTLWLASCMQQMNGRYGGALDDFGVSIWR